MSRYFTHADKFCGTNEYLEVREDITLIHCKNKIIEDKPPIRIYELDFCLHLVECGKWKEISEEEALKL